MHTVTTKSSGLGSFFVRRFSRMFLQVVFLHAWTTFVVHVRLFATTGTVWWQEKFALNHVDVQEIVRNTLRNPTAPVDCETCGVEPYPLEQSPGIAQGVTIGIMTRRQDAPQIA